MQIETNVHRWAQLGPPEMPAPWPLLGEKQKWLRRRQTDAIDPRPCVARGFVNLADAVLHQCIRPLIGARVVLRAIMDISAHSS